MEGFSSLSGSFLQNSENPVSGSVGKLESSKVSELEPPTIKLFTTCLFLGLGCFHLMLTEETGKKQFWPIKKVAQLMAQKLFRRLAKLGLPVAR